MWKRKLLIINCIALNYNCILMLTFFVGGGFVFSSFYFSGKRAECLVCSSVCLFYTAPALLRQTNTQVGIRRTTSFASPSNLLSPLLAPCSLPHGGKRFSPGTRAISRAVPLSFKRRFPPPHTATRSDRTQVLTSCAELHQLPTQAGSHLLTCRLLPCLRSCSSCDAEPLHTTANMAAKYFYRQGFLLLLFNFVSTAALEKRFSDFKRCADEECSSKFAGCCKQIPPPEKKRQKEELERTSRMRLPASSLATKLRLISAPDANR